MEKMELTEEEEENIVGCEISSYDFWCQMLTRARETGSGRTPNITDCQTCALLKIASSLQDIRDEMCKQCEGDEEK